MLVTPAGAGPTLAESGARVTVRLVNSGLFPRPNYPAQDVWLDAGVGEESSFSTCGHFIADASSDLNGFMTISRAIPGGGSCSFMMVYIDGQPLTSHPLEVAVNSPDINGDLVVNLGDFALFATDYETDASRSDLDHNGVVDLTDFSRFGQSYDDTCP